MIKYSNYSGFVSSLNLANYNTKVALMTTSLPSGERAFLAKIASFPLKGWLSRCKILSDKGAEGN
jgi:hypothetical protein